MDAAAAAGGLGDDAELAALRDVLAALGATPPQLVHRKTLCKADVCTNQMRLLISCRSDGADGGGDASALSAFLTEDEKRRARYEYRGGERPFSESGIEVPVYDRHGRRFVTRLYWIEACGVYRLSGNGWWLFLRDNQLPEAMAAALKIRRSLDAELWAFRSTELWQPERRAEGEHHPDGALGVAILIRT